MGGRRIGSLKMRVGRERCIGRGGQMNQVQTVELHKVEQAKEEDSVLVDVGPPEGLWVQQGEQLQE